MTTETLPNEDVLLQILKAKIGLSTTVRDDYLTKIIASVVGELEQDQGIDVDLSRVEMQMFVVDFAYYRYANKGDQSMPRDLQFRLHNFVLGG